MRAIKIAPDRTLRLAQVREPRLRAGEARVAVTACGVCGTDLHMRRSTEIPAGTILGHELAGRIAELGPGVEGWAPGDRVCVFPFAPCGACDRCRSGSEHLCAEAVRTGIGLGFKRGGLAETTVVAESMLHRLPEGLAEERGALAEPLAVGLHAAALGTAGATGPAAVLGAGPIGTMTAIALRSRGAGPVVVAEPNPHRRHRAEQLGFQALGLDGLGPELERALGEPPQTVFECAGSRGATDLAVELAASAGQVVLLGAPERRLAIEPLPLLRKEVRIQPSFAYRRAEFEAAIELLASGRVPADRLITEVAPLERAEAVFAELEQPQNEQLKVLLRP